MIKIQFYALTGDFKFAEKKEAANEAEALKLAKAYAEPLGFTKLKIVEDGDEPSSFRITGTTPGGRAGRNICGCDVREDDYQDYA